MTQHYAMVIDLNTCVGCNACMAACSLENQTPIWADKWRTKVEDNEVGQDEAVRRRFFPRLCNHCDNPPCLTVCPTGATHKTQQGMVLVDDDLCMGCQACALACPYDARFAYTQDDIVEGQKFFGALHRTSPSMDKCSFCAHRLQGQGIPACVQTCPGYARLFGDLDNPVHPVAQLVHSGKARPLMRHLGTGPNVYYVPER